MEKASNMSDRNSRENSLAILERPCTDGCGGTMKIVVRALGWKAVWSCEKCGAERAKLKGDYTLKDALRLLELRKELPVLEKAKKAAREADQLASTEYEEVLDAYNAKCDEIESNAVFPFRDKEKELRAAAAGLHITPEARKVEATYAAYVEATDACDAVEKELDRLEHKA